ncbi:DUF624 domain-containing protein [Microbacterium protaetiae]|uniref:DUF624 domain-containing protein n=1 Tax=Microbacterium protaetiae TaxID=2509458 RepID=A0A4P6EAS0_9MICO|nr:DUF624 domain-containing protein [Microbacterium protaetiae]QAY59074.1 DUF624 domain-containing protein [Microbacterium protaetiae]
MFSYEGMMRINTALRSVYRLAYLNLLWLATTVLGLVVFGIGPASYAMAAYIDGWFRRGQTPPVTRAFFGHVRTQYWRSVAMGVILSGATVIVVTNIFSVGTWLLQFANIVALAVIAVIAAYVFPVMAATDVRGIPRQIAAALMLGVGSLHWTIVAGAVVAGLVWLLYACALPLLVLFGVGIPAAAVGFVTRIVFGQLSASDAQTSPSPRARETSRTHLHLARGTTE